MATMYDKPNFYRIVSQTAERALDIRQDNQHKGKLVIHDLDNSPSQQFAIIVRGIEVMFVNRASNKYLTIINDSDKNGAVFIQEPFRDTQSQKFRLQETAPYSGQYIIFTYCGKSLDCYEDNTKNNTLIIQWGFHAKGNQKWTLQKCSQ